MGKEKKLCIPEIIISRIYQLKTIDNFHVKLEFLRLQSSETAVSSGFSWRIQGTTPESTFNLNIMRIMILTLNTKLELVNVGL
jgi:hypothetical protein